MSTDITQLPRNQISRSDAREIIRVEDGAFRELIVHKVAMDTMSEVAHHCVHRTANTLERIQVEEKRLANLGSVAEPLLLQTEEFKLEYAKRMHSLGLSGFDRISRVAARNS